LDQQRLRGPVKSVITGEKREVKRVERRTVSDKEAVSKSRQVLTSNE